MWCDQAKSVWSRSNSVLIFLTVCTIFTATFCRKSHWNWSIGSKDMSSWRMTKTIRNKRKFSALFGSILKINNRLPTDFAWSHHIWLLGVIRGQPEGYCLEMCRAIKWSQCYRALCSCSSILLKLQTLYVCMYVCMSDYGLRHASTKEAETWHWGRGLAPRLMSYFSK